MWGAHVDTDAPPKYFGVQRVRLTDFCGRIIDPLVDRSRCRNLHPHQFSRRHRSDGGRVDQLAFALPKPFESAPNPERKAKAKKPPRRRNVDVKEAVLEPAHPGCGQISTQPYPSSNLNSPPTPSAAPTAPGPTLLEAKEMDALWLALRSHSDFKRWRRTAGFSSLIRQIVAEKGYQATLDALVGASRDPWWGGTDQRAPEFVHMWHRLLAALRTTAEFDRLAQH